MFKSKITFIYCAALVIVTGYTAIVLGLGSYYCWPNAEVLYLTGDVKGSGIFHTAERLLLNYDGRYFTNFLQGFNPVAWGWVEGCKLMPPIGITLFVFSVYFWQTSFFKISQLKSLAFALAFTVIHFALSPQLSSELFSMIGSYVYLYGICFWMLWTGALWRFINSNDNRHETFWFFLSLFFLIAPIGCSEQILLLSALSLLFLFLFFAFAGKEYLPRLIPFFLTGIICCCFFVSFPGWRVRMIIETPSIHVAQHNAVLLSIKDFTLNFIQLFKTSGLLLPAFLLICLSAGPVSFINPVIKKRSGWLAVAALLFFFFASYLITFAYYLPMGTEDVIPSRIFNVVNTLLQLIFCTSLLALPVFFIPFRNSLGVVLVVWCSTALISGNNNYQQIRTEYWQGVYKTFDDKIKQRLLTLRVAQNSPKVWKNVCLELFPVEYNVIYYTREMQPNRTVDNTNIAYEKYFKLDEVSFCSDTFSKVKELVSILHE